MSIQVEKQGADISDNVVITVFDVESEAFQAFSELRTKISGTGYFAPEVALIRNKDGRVDVLDSQTVGSTTGDGTAMGMVIGSLIGVLGGPIGVILGASLGAYAGSVADTDRAVDVVNSVAVVAGKIYEGDIGWIDSGLERVIASYPLYGSRCRTSLAPLALSASRSQSTRKLGTVMPPA